MPGARQRQGGNGAKAPRTSTKAPRASTPSSQRTTSALLHRQYRNARRTASAAAEVSASARRPAPPAHGTVWSAPHPCSKRRPVALMSVIARWCHRHRLVTVLAWLALIVGLGALTGTAGTKYNDTMSIPASESSQAMDLLKSAIPTASGDSDTVVWHTSGGAKVTDPAVQTTMTQTLDAISK